MLGASAYFAFKIYEHIQTLQDPQEGGTNSKDLEPRGAETFSTFDPVILIERADEAFENNDLQKALALLTEANAKEPNNPDTLFKIAYIRQQSGDDEEAIKYYKEALEFDKDNEYIHNALASAYRKNAEFVSAKMHLNASIAINDTNPVTYYNFGNLLVDMKKDEEAIEMYKKALELNPEFKEAQDELDSLKSNA